MLPRAPLFSQLPWAPFRAGSLWGPARSGRRREEGTDVFLTYIIGGRGMLLLVKQRTEANSGQRRHSGPQVCRASMTPGGVGRLGQ